MDAPLIHTLFERQARRVPTHTALCFETQSLTYAELNRRANQFARSLAERGVRQGDVVGVCIERSAEMVVVVLGILKAGAAYLPLDPAFPQERLHYMVTDAEVALLVVDSVDAHAFAEDRPIFALSRDWSLLDDVSPENLDIGAPADGLAYLIYTSGSTGKPKGVRVGHANVTNFLGSMALEPGLTELDTLLAVTTISFDIHVLELFLPLTVGACLWLASRRTAADPFALKDALIQSGATVMQATPVTWRMLIAAGWSDGKDFKVLIGGEPLPRDLIAPLLKASGELWNMYGPTETTVWSTCHRITASAGPIYIGRPIANTQLYIVDSDGRPVSGDEAGELYIGGAGVTLGYHRRPELTADRFITNPFKPNDGRLYRTGDLARYGEGGLVEHLGRMDNQIKIRGYRIELGEIEAVLATHSDIEHTVVDVVTTAAGDQRLTAFCIAKGYGFQARSLREHCYKLLPAYMVPQHFVQVSELPLTPNGKIDRRTLIASAGPLIEKPQRRDPLPECDLEKSLLVAWRNVLGNYAIDVDDTFVEAGGESILAFDLVLEMERASGVKFPLEKLMEDPSVRDLAHYVSEGKIVNPSNVVPLRHEGGRKPLFCLCGVNLYQELADNLNDDRPIYGIYSPVEIDFMNRIIAGETTHIPVHELASHYCDAILRQRFNGPYYLLGFSFGGLLAVETARQLEQRGETVNAVILVDSILPHALRNNRVKQIKQLANRALSGLRGEPSAEVSRMAVAADGAPGASKHRHVETLRNKAYDDAAMEYYRQRPRFSGKVLLIKARHTELAKTKDLREDYGWSDILLEPPRIGYVDGNHTDLVRATSCAMTAEMIREFIGD